MKPLRIAALSLAVVFWAVPAHADSIPAGDPHFKTGGSGGGDPAGFQVASSPAPAAIITTDFTIESPSGTSPATSACLLFQFGVQTGSSDVCLFENDIAQHNVGVTIIRLVFDISGVASSTVDCATATVFGGKGPFSMCTVGPFGEGGTAVTFFDGSIPYHTDFSVEMDGFPKDTSAAGTATETPEPGTLALFLGGIGALLVGRKLRPRSLS
jgi:hypothetical protein